LVIPAHLIELGQQALAAVTTNVAGGAPLGRCQLLASEFYETLKRELRATSELAVVERAIVVAAANQCRHAATASISPGAMLAELRRDPASYSFVLRGYVRHWLDNVWAEYDRAGLTDIVEAKESPRPPVTAARPQ
jgi:hypothetical protein